MLVESKRLNPLYILLDPIGERYILLGEDKEIPYYDLQIGCVIGAKNYGFNIISSEKQDLYYTQCPIYGLEIKNNLLTIYEEGKNIPWKFSLDGECIEDAKFLSISREDVRYLSTNLGVGSSSLEKVNAESYLFEFNRYNLSKSLNFYTIVDDTLFINSSVKKINRKMLYAEFKNNTTIKKIILEEGIEEITAGAFSDFSCLTTICIPKSIDEIPLYIVSEKIANNLQVFYKDNKFPIIYQLLISRFSEQKTSIKKSIDGLYDVLRIEGNTLHIREVSKKTIDALIILNFSDITTIVIDDEFVVDNTCTDFIKTFYEGINSICSVNKIIFEKKCSKIISKNGVEYQYNERTLSFNKIKIIYPDMAKSITGELFNLLGINGNIYESVFELVLNHLGTYDKYLYDEEKYTKLFIMGFIDIMKELNKYNPIDGIQQDLIIITYIERIIKILFGEKPLISNKTTEKENVDLTKWENYLFFQKSLGIKDKTIIYNCNFNEGKIIMPPLSLFSANSFSRTTFNNVIFENVTASSWQPTFIDGVHTYVEKTLGSDITFKSNLYLELGRDCNAACDFCMNHSFPPEDLDIDSVEKSLDFLLPYLDEIFIGGGEPTLKVELLYKLKHLFQKHSKTPTIFSNGTASFDTYKMIWDSGINIGISRHAISDNENNKIFGVDGILSEVKLSEMIEQQRERRLTIFVTCMPEHIYSTKSILQFIDIFHKIGCNIIFQSPMLDKTLGDFKLIYDLEINPCSSIFAEVGETLKDLNFSSNVNIIGTAGYRIVTYKKFESGIISFKEYITNKEFEQSWPYAIKRTFDLSIKPSGNIYENWNGEGKKLSLSYKNKNL